MANEENLNPDAPQKIYLHVLADSTGRTASSVVCGAVIQFPEGAVEVRGLTHIKSADEVRTYIDKYVKPDEQTTVFHTLLDPNLRNEVRNILRDRGIPSVDLLGPATQIVSQLLNEDPVGVHGVTLEEAKRGVHLLDATYLD